MQTQTFVIPGPAAKVNYHHPVDLIMAVLPRAEGEGVGSLWIDYREISDRLCAHVLYGLEPVATINFTKRFADGTTEGQLVSEKPEFFEMLSQALARFFGETQMVPA